MLCEKVNIAKHWTAHCPLPLLCWGPCENYQYYTLDETFKKDQYSFWFLVLCLKHFLTGEIVWLCVPVILRLQVQYDKYCDLFNEQLGEWSNSEMWETRKIFTNTTQGYYALTSLSLACKNVFLRKVRGS